MVSGLLQRKTFKTPIGLRWALTATCLLLLTLVVRGWWLHAFPAEATAPVDAEGYYLLARNLLEGHGFSIAWEAPFCPNTVRTLLYPLFVALSFLFFGPMPQRIVLLHLLLEVITCAVVIRLGCDLGNLAPGKPHSSYMTGALAGLLYAVNGTTQRYTGFLFSETLLLPLFATAILLSCRFLRRPIKRTAVAAGAFWALALLTKTNGQFLALAIGAVLTGAVIHRGSKNRNRYHAVIWFWLTLTLVLFPWLTRNQRLTSRWILSSAFEENLARVAAVATQAEMMNVHAEPWTATWEYIYATQKTQISLQNGWFFSSIPRFSCNWLAYQQSQIAQAARRFVATKPFFYGKAHIAGVVKSLLDPGHRLWYPILTGKPWSSTGVVPDIGARVLWSLQRRAVGDAIQTFISQRITQIPPSAGIIWWGLWVARLVGWFLVARGLWQIRRHPWTLTIILGSLVYILILPGPIAHDRFYLPAVPIVTAVAAFGGYALITRRE
ncbi:MAG: hypothetical protein E4H27_04730 [Anaerolineales bacterium]|nr:MAG: hypothetical protein E4H27_04730 [Anaerolineales bacterium]